MSGHAPTGGLHPAQKARFKQQAPGSGVLLARPRRIAVPCRAASPAATGRCWAPESDGPLKFRPGTRARHAQSPGTTPPGDLSCGGAPRKEQSPRPAVNAERFAFTVRRLSLAGTRVDRAAAQVRPDATAPSARRLRSPPGSAAVP